MLRDAASFVPCRTDITQRRMSAILLYQPSILRARSCLNSQRGRRRRRCSSPRLSVAKKLSTTAFTRATHVRHHLP